MPKAATASPSKGLSIAHYFTEAQVDPYSKVEWETRDAVIMGEGGKVVFEQIGVEFPKAWSQLATNIVASKYFRGHIGNADREYSLRQLIDRVANTISDHGWNAGYFDSPASELAFRNELKYLLLDQRMAFNSPVWFNVGIHENPQSSACFINSVHDDMGSIMDLAKTEAMLFKGGSGAGVNLSTLRASGEKLRVGGTASGPVSFMKGLDAFAGVVKSGGTTRRAAKMVMLDIDHPDIMEFIDSKAHEEKKAWALIEQGYDASFTGEAYGSVFFQNANHSVRVTDDFMRTVELNGDWTTYNVTDRSPANTYKARDIVHKMAEAAHLCGDPGIQYDSTINKWHTCSNTDRIYASNPCSEYMFLNDTACNLASLNLMKFVSDEDIFNWEEFQQAVRITITAMEIIVGMAGYPTPKIAENSRKFRPLGIGYANLGALLMSNGMAYDSDEGRTYAAAITSLMTGEAYRQSAEIARDCGGPFSEFEKNREPFLSVMNKHADASIKVAVAVDQPLIQQVWLDALLLGSQYGFRNAQASVLAPTGTIAFMMDCDTTGIEPDIALVKYKKLVGEGYLKLVNQTVPRALKKLGYPDYQIESILAYTAEHDTIEGAPHLNSQADLSVFDCAFKPAKGTRSILPSGHIKMMAAVQPFLSGAISKTVNMPEDSSVADIEEIYRRGWEMGLKAIAIYRDGSKRSQPLSTTKHTVSVDATEVDKLRKQVEGLTEQLGSVQKNKRRKLPTDRNALVHKFQVAGHEGYITVGMFPDGTPGELFLSMSKSGSTLSGLIDAFAVSTSLNLQYGVPLSDLVTKFSHTRFEPSGMTGDPAIPMAKSIIDYVFRWLASQFLSPEASLSVGNQPGFGNGYEEAEEAMSSPLHPSPVADTKPALAKSYDDSPLCSDCGSLTVRTGSCYTCTTCATTTGCG